MARVKPDVYYIYVDYRLDTLVPFYVGKGTLARVHYKQRNIIHTRIVEKHGFRRDVLLASKDNQFILSEEVRLIALFRTRDTFGGANLTDGGEGTPGWVPSATTRERIGRANTGKIISDVERARRSKAVKGTANPNYGNLTAPRIDIECRHCKRQFTRRISKASPYCSSKCFYAYRAIEQTGSNNTNFCEKVEVQCPICPNTYYVTQNTVDHSYKQTCSQECGFKLLSIRIKEQHAKKRHN